MLRILPVILVGLAACMDAPATARLPEQAVGVCLGAASGGSCTTDGEWCRTSDECGAEVRFCRCEVGHQVCGQAYSTEEIQACDAELAPLVACQLEGTGSCEQEPVGGGTCGCEGSTWTCHNACDGCPLHPPTDGAPCDTINTCRYAGEQCTCTASGFACTPT